MKQNYFNQLKVFSVLQSHSDAVTPGIVHFDQLKGVVIEKVFGDGLSRITLL